MRVLLIKMSSMGDIFHTFPAITDLKSRIPELELEWVVEEGFAEIASWHPAVTRVIPISLRKWMKSGIFTSFSELNKWKTQFNTEEYDLVLDAQGLLKSALVARAAGNKYIHGFDFQSAREPIASLFYKVNHPVDKQQHAVDRTRQLFAHTFKYSLDTPLNFGINQYFAHVEKQPQKLIFIIGTSWTTKLWSTYHWQRLTALALEEGYDVEIIWGSPEERSVADSIIAACPRATRPQQRMSITAIAEKLVAARGVVGLDTGFSHLAGALETPTIALYGATSPVRVGLIGEHTVNLQTDQKLPCMPCHKRSCKWLTENSLDTPPCMLGVKPFAVWEELQRLMYQLPSSLSVS